MILHLTHIIYRLLNTRSVKKKLYSYILENYGTNVEDKLVHTQGNCGKCHSFLNSRVQKIVVLKSTKIGPTWEEVLSCGDFV